MLLNLKRKRQPCIEFSESFVQLCFSDYLAVKFLLNVVVFASASIPSDPLSREEMD